MRLVRREENSGPEIYSIFALGRGCMEERVSLDIMYSPGGSAFVLVGQSEPFGSSALLEGKSGQRPLILLSESQRSQEPQRLSGEIQGVAPKEAVIDWRLVVAG